MSWLLGFGIPVAYLSVTIVMMSNHYISRKDQYQRTTRYPYRNFDPVLDKGAWHVIFGPIVWPVWILLHLFDRALKGKDFLFGRETPWEREQQALKDAHALKEIYHLYPELRGGDDK